MYSLVEALSYFLIVKASALMAPWYLMRQLFDHHLCCNNIVLLKHIMNARLPRLLHDIARFLCTSRKEATSLKLEITRIYILRASCRDQMTVRSRNTICHPKEREGDNFNGLPP